MTKISLDATKKQERDFYAYLNAQIGKPYDKTAITAFVFNRDWREEDAWYCSELQAAALEDAGLSHPLYLPASKVTPVSLALVMSALGAKAKAA